MTKFINPPPVQSIPGPHADPETVKQLHKVLGGPNVLHDEVITQCDYDKVERRLLEQMNEFLKPEDIVNDFAMELAASLAALIREGLPKLRGFELVDIRTSRSGPAVLLTLQKEPGICVIASINVGTDAFDVVPAFGRNDVRTPGPIDGPMVPTFRYWHRPHPNALGEPCHGEPGADNECVEYGCPYNGEDAE